MIITQTEIEQEKSKIILKTKQLQDSIHEFQYAFSEIEDVINGLRVVANTCGGYAKTEKIRNLANIDFHQVQILSVIDDIQSISIVADKTRVDL